MKKLYSLRAGKKNVDSAAGKRRFLEFACHAVNKKKLLRLEWISIRPLYGTSNDILKDLKGILARQSMIMSCIPRLWYLYYAFIGSITEYEYIIKKFVEFFNIH